MAAFQVPSVFTAIDRITAPIRKMTSSVLGFVNKTSVGIARVERRFAKMFRTINSMAGGFGLFLGASLGLAVLTNGIKIIADYEQANANLASVLGVSTSQTEALQRSSQQLGATTAFTASEVAGLQTEFAKLGFVQKEILGATGATLSLAAATRTELPQAALQVGAAIRAYGLDASEAGRVADVFAASTSKSALDMEKLNVAMSKVAPVAKQFGFSIEDSVALMGKLSDAGFDASTMATSTRSIILNLADSNGKLAKALGKPARNLTDITKAMVKMRNEGIDLAKMLDLTDKRSVAAFATFLETAEGIDKLGSELQRSGGFAELMAMRQLDTLRGSITLLRSAYEGFIISLATGNSQFTRTLRTIVDVTAGVFNLLTITQEATGEAGKMGNMMLTVEGQLSVAKVQAEKYNARITEIAKTTLRVLKITKNLVLAYLALKAIIIITRTAYAAYSIAVGIAAAIQGKSAFAVKANTIALKAHLIATKAITIAQRAFNLVMLANPIGLIIAAIAALIALVVVVVKKYDEWGAAVTLLMGPLGLVINLVMAFRRNWDLVKQAFTTGGMVNGLKAIGFTIADALLVPIEQLFNLIKDFTGIDIGGIAEKAGLARQLLQAGLEITAGGEPSSLPSINPDATRDAAFVERSETVNNNQNATVLIKDETGKAEIDTGETSDGLDVRLEPSFSF